MNSSFTFLSWLMMAMLESEEMEGPCVSQRKTTAKQFMLYFLVLALTVVSSKAHRKGLQLFQPYHCDHCCVLMLTSLKSCEHCNINFVSLFFGIPLFSL